MLIFKGAIFCDFEHLCSILLSLSPWDQTFIASNLKKKKNLFEIVAFSLKTLNCLSFRNLQKVTQRQRGIQWLIPYNCLGSSPLTLGFSVHKAEYYHQSQWVPGTCVRSYFCYSEHTAVSIYWKQSKKDENLTKPGHHTECLTLSWQRNNRKSDIHRQNTSPTKW